MVQAKSCDGCSQAHDCQRIYEQLGHTGGPSIAGKVFIVFALPIIVFTATLAGFGRLLQERLGTAYQTPVAFFLATAATVGFMLLISLAVKRFHKEQ